MNYTEIITKLLTEQNFQWVVNGKMHTPDERDVEDMVNSLIRMLNQARIEGSVPQAESGGLIIQKHATGYDIYCRVASIV